MAMQLTLDRAPWPKQPEGWTPTHNGGGDRTRRLQGGGFTLIELLVVIGIIGILAGLLLPVLSRARERGRATACANRLKQIGVGMVYYTDDYDYYPPGRQAAVTQWDLCVGMYLGGKPDLLSPEARTELFMCPSARVANQGLVLNFSANPNVCKEVTPAVGPVRADSLGRPAEGVVIADAIQYAPDGGSHAIFWGVLGSGGSAIYWNDGALANADRPLVVGPDADGVKDVNDPAGSNFRYRHSGKINVLFADGHMSSLPKGQVRDRHVYTGY